MQKTKIIRVRINQYIIKELESRNIHIAKSPAFSRLINGLLLDYLKVISA